MNTMNLSKEFYIKQLHTADITPGFLQDFAHSQRITKKWVKKNEVWELTDVSILREWSAEKRIGLAGYIRRQIESGGITAGAFFREQLVGFCCVDGTITGAAAKYANLTLLFVDDHWKRKGIGNLLFQEACQYAINLGAEKLFISAIPSAETIAFYHKMGCVDANEVIESFVDLEDDRYLEFTLIHTK